MATIERPSLFRKLLARAGFVDAAEVSRLVNSTLLASPQTLGFFTGAKTYQQIVESYKSWTYICVDKIAKTVAMLPMHLYAYRRGGKFITGHQIKCQVRELSGNKRELVRYMKADEVERVEITSHPFLDLQRTPNEVMTRLQLWYHIITRLELAGYCGLFMPRNGQSGIPSSIWPLPLTKTAILKATLNREVLLASWRYEDGDVRKDMSTDECKVILYPDPEHPFTGKSPLLAQQLPYDIDSYLDQQQRAFLMKHSAFGNVFSTDHKLTEAQVASLRILIKSQYAGAQNSGDSIFLHSGLRLDRSIVTNDAMNVDLARYARDKLIATHDLTPSHVGIDREVNRTTMEVLDDVFIRECLRPKTQLVEEFFESFVLPMYDDRLLLDFELPDTKDKDQELKKRDSNLDRAYSTVNEEREKEGLEPVEWGDVPLPKILQTPPTTVIQNGTGASPAPATPAEPAVGDGAVPPQVGLNGAQITAAIALVDQLRQGLLTGESAAVLLASIGISQDDVTRMVAAEEKAPKKEPPAAPVPSAVPPASAPVSAAKEPVPPVPAAKSASPGEVKEVMSEETKTALWNGYAKKTEAWEAHVAKAASALFEQQYERVVKRLNSEGSKYISSIAGWSKDKIRQHIKAHDSTAKVNLDRKAEIAATKEMMEPLYKAILLDFGTSRIHTLLHTPLKAVNPKPAASAVAVSFNMNDPKIEKWLGTKLEKFSEEITGTTFDAVKAVLREGFAEGKPLPTIAQELRDMFTGAEQYRAANIARTETLAASNYGDIEGVMQSGQADSLVKHWLSARDGHERETHQAADAQYSEGIPIDEDFQVGADTMIAPGNGSLPEEVCNCRCNMYYSQKE